MSEELVFYHNPRSRAQMAHWMLEEIGAPYRTVIVDFQAGENRKPEFLAINPMGKLPTLSHGGTVVTETGAIIAYLADAFPQAGLAPPVGDRARGAYYRWLFFGAGCFEPALIDKLTHRPDAQRQMIGYGSYDEVIGALLGVLSKSPYLLGEAFSAADLYVGAQINWAMMFGGPGLKGVPAFDAYVARITERPAYKRAAAKDAG
jgi:glutathione S-transferase